MQVQTFAYGSLYAMHTFDVASDGNSEPGGM